jgi:hypothetical protein
MTVPVWLGYFMMTAFSMMLVGAGLMLIAYAGGVLLNVIIPSIWVSRQRYKIKNMDREQLDAFIHALRYEWTENRINREKEHEPTKD